MWKLVRLSLAYHRKPLLWTLVIALLLTKLGLVAAAIAGALLFSAENKERRLLLHLSLPVTSAQVGWARIVFPATVLFLGTVVVTLPPAISALVGGGAWPFARIVQERLFLATLLMFFLQLLLTIGELQVWGGGRLLRTFMAGAVVVALLAVTLVAWVTLAVLSASYLVTALGTLALTLGLMGLTVFLFQQRPSFITG